MSACLILGGARSGKSAYAEKLANASGRQVVYIATATAGDAEMQQRIEHHQSRRPANWKLVEEPVRLAEAIRQYADNEQCILVDCLTLWVTNLLSLEEAQQQQELSALLEVVSQSRSEIIMVSNEVGMGIVPMGELSRQFCDETGRLHQQLAQVCQRVIFMVAGLPMYLKGNEG